MSDFTTLKAITIPEGKAIRVTTGGQIIHDRIIELKYRLHADKSNYIVDGAVAGSAGDVVMPVDYIDGIRVWEINENAFQNNDNIRVVVLPKTVGYLTALSFDGCTNLEMVTFKRTPADGSFALNTQAFTNCPNLKTINVPWAEGAVSNAPWGATNATINYNYTG